MSQSALNPVSTANQATRGERRHELDVLTTLIVFGLMFMHTASIFSGQQLVVNRMQRGPAATVPFAFFVVFEFIWIMPALMFIAGIAICYSLRRRTADEFVRERLMRLGMPFLTGLVFLNAPQIYYYLLDRTNYQQTFWQFYPQYWNIKFSLRFFPYFIEAAGEENFSVSHLWFLIYLLTYTLLLLPLILYLRTPAGERLVERVAGFFSRRLAIFLLAIPIVLLEGILGASWLSGWNRWIWPFFIVYGYLCAADQRLTQALVRHRTVALLVGLVGFLVFFMGTGILMGMQIDVLSDPGVPSIILRFVKAMTAW